MNYYAEIAKSAFLLLLLFLTLNDDDATNFPPTSIIIAGELALSALSSKEKAVYARTRAAFKGRSEELVDVKFEKGAF